MPKDVVLEQDIIETGGNKFTVTRIPTATTSGSWFVIHDAFEVWAAMAADDFSGKIIGWRCPPREEDRAEIENAIKKAFGIPVQC
ncbi:MAG: hypothetical protein Q8O55_01585 [Dehalococcoidales bacterium]|nr:hypothetical protein [Dehalococcoidales bacterium]